MAPAFPDRVAPISTAPERPRYRRSLADLVGDHASADTQGAEHECLARAVYYEAQGEPLGASSKSPKSSSTARARAASRRPFAGWLARPANSLSSGAASSRRRRSTLAMADRGGDRPHRDRGAGRKPPPERAVLPRPAGQSRLAAEARRDDRQSRFLSLRHGAASAASLFFFFFFFFFFFGIGIRD